VDVNLSVVDVDYQYLVVRLYKLDVDYHPPVVRLSSLDIEYHYVDVDVQYPFPDVLYIRTISHSIAEPFMHAKPCCANHMLVNPHGLFTARIVTSEPTPLFMSPYASH
jgi:hypothetical protein